MLLGVTPQPSLSLVINSHPARGHRPLLTFPGGLTPCLLLSSTVSFTDNRQDPSPGPPAFRSCPLPYRWPLQAGPHHQLSAWLQDVRPLLLTPAVVTAAVEYWSGLPFPSPGDLPRPGVEPVSPALAGGFFTTKTPGKPSITSTYQLMAQMVKNLPAVRETQVRSLVGEDALEKGRATHSSISACRIPQTEEHGGLQSTGSQSQT